MILKYIKELEEKQAKALVPGVRNIRGNVFDSNAYSQAIDSTAQGEKDDNLGDDESGTEFND